MRVYQYHHYPIQLGLCARLSPFVLAVRSGLLATAQASELAPCVDGTNLCVNAQAAPEVAVGACFPTTLVMLLVVPDATSNNVHRNDNKDNDEEDCTIAHATLGLGGRASEHSLSGHLVVARSVFHVIATRGLLFRVADEFPRSLTRTAAGGSVTVSELENSTVATSTRTPFGVVFVKSGQNELLAIAVARFLSLA